MEESSQVNVIIKFVADTEIQEFLFLTIFSVVWKKIDYWANVSKWFPPTMLYNMYLVVLVPSILFL